MKALAMTNWMTTLEASRLLGLSSAAGGTIDTLRNAGIEERRDGGPGRGGRCLWRCDQVEEVVAERERATSLIAAGFKWCAGCEEWKDRQAEFAPSAHRCRPCMKKISKAAWGQQKHQGFERRFANANPEPLPGPMSDYLDLGPPDPKSVEKYACLHGWFQHKPIPPGTTKRKAFCKNCKAERCVHHPELTAGEVVKMGQVPSRYPEYQVHDYTDA